MNLDRSVRCNVSRLHGQDQMLLHSVQQVERRSALGGELLQLVIVASE
jgi:hypothetical protein